MFCVEERLALVEDGAHDHAQREHVAQRVTRLVQLDLRGHVVQVRLGHLRNLCCPRLAWIRVLVVNKRTRHNQSKEMFY